MISQLAEWVLPRAAVVVLRQQVARRRSSLLRKRLRAVPRRVVIGASGVFEAGWVPTDERQINLLRPETWRSYFEPDSIDALLAEHVWEHLTVDEGKAAAALCHRYLRPGGYLRVAVPDGLHPDRDYREYIKPGGVGGGSVGGHQVAYTYRQLKDVFESVGFRVRLLEYHDETGVLHATDWSPRQGMIHRSRQFDSRGAISIILDAEK